MPTFIQITRNVPCTRRIKDLNANQAVERELEDGWVEAENPTNYDSQGGVMKKQEVVDIDDIGNVVDGGEAELDQNQEAVDIDDIAANQTSDKNTNIFASGQYVVMNEPEDNVHKVRSYDLSITYDFYFQTPRLWLIGYSEEGQVLKEEEIF